MPHARAIAVVLVAGALTGCVLRATAPSAGASVHERQLLSTFTDSARANRIIGAQVAVHIPGQPLWSAEFGENARGTPMTADRLLGTGSISKMFAAVAALRLVDARRISMSDTLGRWFAAYRNIPPSITVRSLLWHQSGLPEYGEGAGFADSVAARGGREWTRPELIRFVGPASFAPGSQWRASNTDRLLLGTIVEAVTGMPYGAYLAKEMLRGGDGSFWTPGQGQPSARIATHWVVGANGERVDFSAQRFGPALFTQRIETYISARDLARFARRLFEGDLLSASARAQLLTIVDDDKRIPAQTGGGVGIRRFNFGGTIMYGNSGATTNSSAIYLYEPVSGAIVALSTNQSGESHGNSHFRIAPALMQLAMQAGRSRR